MIIEYDSDDLDASSLCAWKEARGDGNAAMRANIHIQVNRVAAPDFPKTLHDVIYQKNAFTSMTVTSDPEFNLIPQSGNEAFLYCESIVESVLRGTDPDITNGARYYDNPKYVTSSWYQRKIIADPSNHPQVATIGRQNFYA